MNRSSAAESAERLRRGPELSTGAEMDRGFAAPVGNSPTASPARTKTVESRRRSAIPSSPVPHRFAPSMSGAYGDGGRRGKPTEEEIKAFFARHAREARLDPTKDFWWLSPLCPPAGMDALDAFRQLHRELRQWVTDKGRRDAGNMRFWDAAEALRRGHVYGDPPPLAQIAWLTGPRDWPARLLMGRSYGGGKTFLHEGRRHYLEPQDGHVLGLMPLIEALEHAPPAEGRDGRLNP